MSLILPRLRPAYIPLIMSMKNIYRVWEQEHEEAFLKTKQALSYAPFLAFPNPSVKFILDTDASDVSIGGVLSQLQDGKEVVIC